jgi:hypothetical protein
MEFCSSMPVGDFLEEVILCHFRQKNIFQCVLTLQVSSSGALSCSDRCIAKVGMLFLQPLIRLLIAEPSMGQPDKAF